MEQKKEREEGKKAGRERRRMGRREERTEKDSQKERNCLQIRCSKRKHPQPLFNLWPWENTGDLGQRVELGIKG